jgi:hypothetical protein
MESYQTHPLTSFHACSIIQTAYFVISENAKHGEDLVCSYFACRNGGVKFRYCAHCMAPVAKRNFCRRHDHGVSGKKQKSSLIASGNDDDEDGLDESEHTAGREPGRVLLPNTKGSKETQNPSVKVGVASSGKRGESESEEDSENPTDRGQDGNVGKETTTASIGEKRRKMWRDLLAQRPRTKDPRLLSPWLNEVLSVTDMDFPLEHSDIDQGPPAAFYNGAPKSYGLAPAALHGGAIKSRVAEMGRVADVSYGDKPKADAKSITKTKRKERAVVKVPTKVVKKIKVKKGPGSSTVKEGKRRIPVLPLSSTKKDRKRKEDQKRPAEKNMEDNSEQPTPAYAPAESHAKAEHTRAEQDGFVGSFADWRH